MERYKVYYGKDTNDFAIIYADTEEEAREEFKHYHPDWTPIRVEAYPKKPDLLTLYKKSDFADEHEYLLAIIEAVQDAGVEEKVVDFLQRKGWGR